MSRPYFTLAARSPSRRGKWHLLESPVPWSARTICDRRARGWEQVDIDDVPSGDLCLTCLRGTP